MTPSGGEWQYAAAYEHRLAAHWWRITPDVWAEKPVGVRAEMLVVYRIEMARRAVEDRERERAAERERQRSASGRSF